METKGNINLNVRKTVENSVAGNEDFHFYVDELTSRDYMPTYAGMADEKYGYDEMDDEFFEFVERKASEDGIYIRLVFATGQMGNCEAVFHLEYGGSEREFRTSDVDNVLVFEFADFGVKVKGDEVTFGATIDGGCGHNIAVYSVLLADANKESIKNPYGTRICTAFGRTENSITAGAPP